MGELSNSVMCEIESHGKKGMAYKDLHRKLRIKPKQAKKFKEILKEFKDNGALTKIKGCYVSTKCLNAKKAVKPKFSGSRERVYPEKSLDGAISAKIVRVNKTYGFARTIEDDVQYFIPGKFLMGTLPGDEVLVRAIPARGDSPEGEVVKIVSMGSGEFIGRIVKVDGESFIEPDTLMKIPLSMNAANLNGAHEGDKVLAKIIKRGQRHSEHVAEIVQIFGDSGTAASCAEAILQINDIPLDFPAEVYEKAAYLQKRGLKAADYERRVDLRNEIIFTIDGADSKDLDDAVSIAKFSDYWELGVHIADVSNYVSENGAIDNEAFYRGTSIYYADKVIPMLPPELSNGICSLNPNEDRLALSAILTLDSQGSLIDFDFKKSVIRSRVKGVYSEINAIIDGTADEQISSKYADLHDKILLMKELCDIRLKRKEERGAPAIVTNESKIVTDENGVTIDILPRKSGVSENIIEEFMLLANEAAATAARLRCVPFVYRVHEPPSEPKLAALNSTLKLLGVQTRELTPNVKPKALAEILKKVVGTPIATIVNVQVLRSMSKARYSEIPLGHYGLALENYAHFTSPIRRYPDLVVHRILSELIKEKPPAKITADYQIAATKAAARATQTELVAMRIERDCEDCYKAEYMKKHIGETFDGVISSVAFHGIYVELANTVEGLVRVEDFPDGDYEFDEIMEYKNLRTGTGYRIGDKIRVICTACDVNSGNIDFGIEN